MSKRIICLLLAFCMMMTVFAGCGTTIDEEPSTTTAATDSTDGTDEVSDNTDSEQTGSSLSDEWTYDFDSSFISENGIEYVWERLDEDTRINLGEIMNAIREGQIYCPLTVGFPNSEREDFLKLVSNCCTYYVWAGTSFSVSIDDTDTVVGVMISYRGIEYESDISPIMYELESKLQEIVAGMPSDGTEFEKLKYLHDYLILNCDYSDSEGTSPFSAYGALCEGYATCQGYADAMHLLLNRAGFETMFVTGVGTDSAVTHKWNYVMCEDGHWYIIDPTWDDPEDITDPYYVGYCYFLISDEEILKDHQSKHESNYYEVPVADSMDMNYFTVTGYYADNYDDAYTVLMEEAQNIIDTERRCLYLKCDSSDTMRSIYDSLKDTADIADIIAAANEAAGTNYLTNSWSRTFNDELGILTITLKEE